MALFIGTTISSFAYESLAIIVFAGEDTSMCDSETLELSTLNAEISGDVNDGMWFTNGDGYFLPNDSENEIFSIATHYVPGPQDINNGGFSLILVSDDPDGNGPLVEQSDNVLITFNMPPSPSCVSNINLSLNDECNQLLDVTMLITNPHVPYDKYIVKSYDEDDNEIPNNLLESEHIGQNITFSVVHECTGIGCWGSLTVEDKLSPQFQCTSIEVSCGDSIVPEVIGFPIPQGFSFDTISDFTYLIHNWDACGDASLSYSDDVVDLPCTSEYDRQIIREWRAVDEYNNNSICNQSIYVLRKALDDVELPPHYNDIEEPSIQCNDVYLQTENGYPSPEVTGYPTTFDCSDLEATYTDAEFDQCGAGYKVARNWFVIDWCSYESFNHIQIIKVSDDIDPILTCPDDVVIYTKTYTCVAESSNLPWLDMVEDCSSYEVEITLEDTLGNDYTNYLSVNGEMISVEDLPLGEYEVFFEVTDDCNNDNICSYKVTIVDDKVPFMVCDHFTSVALGADGTGRLYAISLDDGSFDNCAIDSFFVAKMEDECGWGLDFDEYIEFCCAEAGETKMVALKATDIHGLSNTCMVEVMIEEKLPPTITCPDHITVSCDYIIDYSDLSVFGEVQMNEALIEPITIYDQYNNGIAGYDGYIYDNCKAEVVDTFYKDISCFEGTISRKFTVEDPAGSSDSCFQTITIVNLDPFAVADIIWPDNYEDLGCNITELTPDITGGPTYQNEYCAIVEATYEDQNFFIADGACIKILREWTVIEWCQFEENQNSIWNHTQIIKVFNSTPPEFSFIQQDTSVCAYDEFCVNGNWLYKIIGTDDCTADSLLAYEWRIDEFSDGDIDHSGISDSMDLELPHGTHSCFLSIEDKCGNRTTHEFNIEMKDCKVPSPYCKSSLTTTVMDSFGFVTVWASDFDLGSTDNCTAPEDLYISFSADINHTSETFYCEDIPNGVAAIFELEIWVTDEYENKEYCTVEIAVQDNVDQCEDLDGAGVISGVVGTRDGELVENVKIYIESSEGTYSDSTLTNEEGAYMKSDLLSGLSYLLTPSYESETRDGVSTIDIVLLQRHILKLKQFNDPYKVLAGDVNGSGSLSASDLVEMRKVILGLQAKYKNDKPTWVFVDQDYVFSDTLNPWEYPNYLNFEAFNGIEDNANFTAVKRGDVNGDWSSEEFGNKGSGNRNISEVEWKVWRSEELLKVVNTSSELIYGFQLTIDNVTDDHVIISSEYEDLELDYAIVDEKLNIIATSPYGLNVRDNSNLLIIEGNIDNAELGSVLTPEIYTVEGIFDINWKIEDNFDKVNTIRFVHTSSGNIMYTGADILNADLHLYSTDGNMITLINDSPLANGDTFDLNHLPGGVYIAYLRSKEGTYSQKMISL